MSPRLMRTLRQVVRFPRVSGDEPTLHTAVKCSTGFSPRERG